VEPDLRHARGLENSSPNASWSITLSSVRSTTSRLSPSADGFSSCNCFNWRTSSTSKSVFCFFHRQKSLFRWIKKNRRHSTLVTLLLID
jgi:hypothetical protein